MANTNNTKKLTPKEKNFCKYYVETGNGAEAVRRAGYKINGTPSGSVTANRLLKKNNVREEIARLQEKSEKSSIMSGQEVMQHFSAIARGEEKDQFGLDIGASDRIKALVELAKRTVDIDNRIAGKADAKVEIKVDWKR